MSKAPPRLRKRYTLPDYCDCREVVMRELEATDDIQSAIWADAHATSALKGSAVAAIQADRRESIRLSMVEVDGEPVNVDGVPFMGMDRWSHRTLIYVEAFFNDLNGVDTGDLKKAIAGGTVVLPSKRSEEVESGDQPIDG